MEGLYVAALSCNSRHLGNVSESGCHADAARARKSTFTSTQLSCKAKLGKLTYVIEQTNSFNHTKTIFWTLTSKRTPITSPAVTVIVYAVQLLVTAGVPTSVLDAKLVGLPVL